MQMDIPTTVPGHELAAKRKGYGVTRSDLAKHLNLHRNTVLAWEQDAAVDVIRQRRYLTALQEIVEAAA